MMWAETVSDPNSDVSIGPHRRQMNLWLARLSVAIAVAATVIFITHGITAARSFVTQRRQFASMTLYSRETADGASLNLPFLGWVRARLLANDHDDATFWFASTPTSSSQSHAAEQNTLLYQYSMYLLAPARSTSTLDAAQWVVLYGQTPRTVHLSPQAWHVVTFSNGYSLARRRR
jgi:hypothetical protein